MKAQGPDTQGNKVRLSLDLSPSATARLEQLRAMFDDNPSKTDVVRRALTLLEYLKTKSDSGVAFKIVDRDGKEAEVPLALLLEIF